MFAAVAIWPHCPSPAKLDLFVYLKMTLPRPKVNQWFGNTVGNQSLRRAFVWLSHGLVGLHVLAGDALFQIKASGALFNTAWFPAQFRGDIHDAGSGFPFRLYDLVFLICVSLVHFSLSLKIPMLENTGGAIPPALWPQSPCLRRCRLVFPYRISGPRRPDGLLQCLFSLGPLCKSAFDPVIVLFGLGEPNPQIIALYDNIRVIPLYFPY